MQRFLQRFVNWLYNYGKANAGMPSIRGSYEVPVPECLKRV